MIFTILHFTFPLLLKAAISTQLKLDDGNEFMTNWLNPPIAINFKFHFFHVLNPVQAANGEKVRVKEVGPYWFK